MCDILLVKEERVTYLAFTNFYIGLTDYDWYKYHKSIRAEEVNFWRPGSQPFKALPENGLFLFKLKKKHGSKIVGGGFFKKYINIPISLAWDSFGERNGVRTEPEFTAKIRAMRARNNLDVNNPNVGCIILTDTFWLTEENGIPGPSDWSINIVTGANCDASSSDGKRILEELKLRLSSSGNRYSITETKHRLGQGGFRVLVTEAYKERCAISGEKTLPVLEAAHIQDFACDGPHEVQNGILLRSDIHTLYDKGYLTITSDLRVEVSHRLHEDFGNGKIYYQYHGKELQILPDAMDSRPAKEFLEWHNENRFLG